MNEHPRFWRNLILIALAHLLLIVGIFWLARDRNGSGGSDSGEKIVWMDPATFTGKHHPDPTPEPEQTPEPTPAPTLEPTPEATPEETPLPALITTQTLVPQTPTPTPRPKPTPRPTPKPHKTPTPTPRPRPKPSPTPKKKPTPTPDDSDNSDEDSTPTPKAKKPKATATPHASPKKTPAEDPSDEPKPHKIPKAVPVNPGDGDGNDGQSSTDDHPGGKGSGTGKGQGDGAAAGVDPGLLDAYNALLNNRFNGAWVQPTAEAKAGYKFTVTMHIVISKDGTVADFSQVHSSGNQTVDDSVNEAFKSVTRLPAPPTGKEYVININFVLNGDE